MTIHDELLARHRQVLPSWLALYYEQPISIVRGQGLDVWDAEGNQYLDFFGGILTTMCGYGVEPVVRAIQEQAERMLHTSTLYLIEPMIELAEKVAKLSGIPNAKVFFTNSGTEANDTALLLATAYRRSNQILALRNSYHGRSFSALAVTGNRGWSPTSLSPVQVSYVHGGYTYRSPFRHLPEDQFIAACVDDLRDVLATTTSGDVACMIAEPIQGVGGFLVPPDGMLGAMKSVLDESGILFISDEVQTGWGRTGDHFWGYEAHGMVPDMLTFAKGVGNGLSLGGVVARAEVMDCIKSNSISTFGGNPLVAAGALANLDYLLDQDLQTNAAKVGQRLKNRLRDLGEREPMIGEVRGRGLMLGVEIVQPNSGSPGAPSPETTSAILEATRERGLLVGKGGMHGNVLRIAPPLSITNEQADDGADRLADAFAEVSNRS